MAPTRIRTLLLALALAAVAIGVGGCGDDAKPAPGATEPVATTPATTTTATTATTTTRRPPAGSFTNAELRGIGGNHAERELAVETSANEIALVRSKRDPSWAIVSGASGRELWVVWLRDGEVQVATKDVMQFNPPSVPCDVRPAFSEPYC